MIFEKDDLSFHILDVIKNDVLNRRVDIYNTGRNFDTISIHFDSDTWVKTETAEYSFNKNYITYIPARLDYRRITTTSSGIAIHFETPNYTSKNIEYFEAKNFDKLTKLFLDIADSWNKKEPGYTYRCSAIFNEILEECYLQNHHPKSYESKIKASVDYLNENFRDVNLSMPDVAQKSYISGACFRKIFKDEYGMTVMDYVMKKRMEKAVRLLTNSELSIREIAEECGFGDDEYFSRCFKNAYGAPPKQWRRENSELRRRKDS